MMSVPLRGLQLLLAVTVHVTVAEPEPLAGEQVSHPGALLEAVHSQSVPAVTLTVTVPLPATAPTLAPGTESEYVQGTYPACVTVNDWPAMFNVPLRALVLVFASTLKDAVPLALPLLVV